MKETLVLFILQFCANLSQTLDQEDLSNEILENSLLFPKFSWIDPLSIQVTFPGHGKDKLNLRPFGRVAETDVPCLFNGIFEKDMWGSAVVSGCKNGTSIYITIYSSHLPGKTSFIWDQAGVTDVINPYADFGNETESNEDYGFDDGQMKADDEKRVKRGTFDSDYYEYEEYYEEDYYDNSFDGPPPPIPSDVILQVKLGYEESFLQQMNGDKSAAQAYCAEVAAHGSVHMRHVSRSTRIHLEFMGPPQFLSGKTMIIDKQNLKQVRDSKKDSIPLIVFVKTDDTNETAMGVAWPGYKGGACDEDNSAAILKWRSNPLTAAITFAHENGHLTGQLHDENEDKKNRGMTSCEGTGIMSKGNAKIERPIMWSKCSDERFKKWFPRRGQCLITAPSCDTGDGWKTPCTCGSGDASMVCLSSHSYCWKKYFGESPYQCLSSEELEKDLATPQRGDLENADENLALPLVMDKLLLKQVQQEKRIINQENLVKDQQIMMKKQEKLIENLIKRLEMERNDTEVSANKMDSENIMNPSVEGKVGNQENLKVNLINILDVEGSGEELLSSENNLKDPLIGERLRNQEILIQNLIDQFYIEKNRTEERFRDQENLFEQLDRERNGTEVSSNNEQDMIIPAIERRLSLLEKEKSKVFRTCDELQQSGVKTSGFYELDPDGIQIGHSPINAYCNFDGQVPITEIPHDNDEKLLNIPYCNSKFCHVQPFTYTAHMDQIFALMELSSFCDQRIQFECNGAPLSQGGVQFGAWVDRHGEDQVYFHGENYGRHICSCEATNTCSGNQFLHNTCNCDNTAVRDWMKDSGKLSNLTALPVMSFKYGPFMFPSQQAKVAVGRLRCGGRKAVGRIPHSCRDLKLLGETRPGLYPLQDAQHENYPKMSFCQLDKPGYGDDLELSSHWFKLSSGPRQEAHQKVFFGVKHSGHKDISNGAVITFDTIVANEGQAMDPSTGVFTAPVDGVYDFKLSGMTSYSGTTYADVYLNDSLEVRMYHWTSHGNSNSINRVWQFNLKQGDKVTIRKENGHFRGSYYGLYFIGMLM